MRPLNQEPQAEIDCLGESLNWKVTSAFEFRQLSHINLQEMCALKKEVERLSYGKPKSPSVQLVLVPHAKVVVVLSS